MVKISVLLSLTLFFFPHLKASYFSDGIYETIGSKYVVDAGNQKFVWRGVENATRIEKFNNNSGVVPYLHRDLFDLEDDCYSKYSFEYRFLYYGSFVDDVIITSNGFLVFPSALSFRTGENSTFYHRHFRNNNLDAMANVVAPFWDDLYLGNGDVYYEIRGENGSREFIVTWENLEVMGVPLGDAVSFQVVFEEATKDIIFNYRDVDLASQEHSRGGSATVGMTNVFGTGRTLYSFNEPALYSGQSIRFNFEYKELAPYFKEIISQDDSGSNQVDVKIDYAGLIPTTPCTVSLGTEPNSDDLGRINLYENWIFRDSCSFFDLPPNEDMLFLTFNSTCYTSNDDGEFSKATFVANSTFVTQVQNNKNFVHGKLLKSSIGSPDEVTVPHSPVTLWVEKEDGFHVIAEKRTDHSGHYRFSNLPSGTFRISSNEVGSESFSIDNSLARKDLDVLNDAEYYEVILNNGKADFRWRVKKDTQSFVWVLKNADGVELLKYEKTYPDGLWSSIYSEERYTPDYSVVPGERYLWDVSGYDSEGNLTFQNLNKSLIIGGGEYPMILYPTSGMKYPYSRKFRLGFYLGTIPVDEWKIELSGEKNGTPFWESSKHHDGRLFFETIPRDYSSIHAKVSYKTSDGWHDMYTNCELSIVPEYDIEMVSPKNGESLSKNNQEFVFRFVGEAKDFGPDIYEVDILSKNGVEYVSSRATDGFVQKIGEEYHTTIGVLPTSGEELWLRVRYAEGPTGRKLFPITAHFQGHSGQQDYSVDDSILYEWIDATLGKRLDLKGSFKSKDIKLPFTFTFYGQNYQYLRVKEEGYVTFGSGCEEIGIQNNEGFPDKRTPNGYIAPHRSNTDLSSGGRIFIREIGEAPYREFVVQWDDVGFTSYALSKEEAVRNTITFQMIIHESSNEVTFQYKDVVVDEEGSYKNYGKWAFIGLENQDGTKAAVYGAKSQVLKDSLAIRFIPQ